jgi:FkbH-like protein
VTSPLFAPIAEPRGQTERARSSVESFGFLDARRIITRFEGGPEFPFLFAMSGTPEPIGLYLDAACAKRGRAARVRFLDFGTLGQFIASRQDVREAEAVLLFPWDFVPELDWRSGVPTERVDVAAAISRAEAIAASLAHRAGSQFLFVPAPTPPVTGYTAGDDGLRRSIEGIAIGIGATLVPGDAFSIGTYLASGCPIGGGWLGRVADMAVHSLLAPPTTAAKVLVTDLDNTLWNGVIAELGAEHIAYGPDGAGFRHFVYQTVLARLRREGVMLAAVSRNDRATVDPPLVSGRMTLSTDDFVAVCATYEAKSAQVLELARRLNVSTDAFVFVDDNSIECEEVRAAIPNIRVLSFPDRDDQLPAFLKELTAAFSQRALTSEDRERTALYRRRLEGMVPSTASGADLTAFLAGLSMRLVLHDRSRGDRARAVQLINKTNQFNANGRRWSEPEVAAALARGARLYTASLTDRAGSHGEIIACLVAAGGLIEAFVMSCRVFQRRVEDAFLSALIEKGVRPTAVRFAPTDRNEPFRQFVTDPAFVENGDAALRFDDALWLDSHRTALDLMEVSWD